MRRSLLILTISALVVTSCSDDDAASSTVAATSATTATTAAPSSTTTTAVATTLAPRTTTTTTMAATTTTAAVTTTTSTTTTTVAASTTTTTAPPATTTTLAPTGAAPQGEITSPSPLTLHAAAYDANLGDFVAQVSLSATGTDPDGDTVTYAWYSSDQGFLGEGESLTAALSTMGSDAAQPFITLVMTDGNGNVTETQIQLIVWIPSE